MTRLYFASILLIAALLSACGSSDVVPVINKSPFRVIPPVVTVEAGQNIYTLSWEHGVDYQDIAEWNGLVKPYKVHPGERLRLKAGSSGSSSSSTVSKVRSVSINTKSGSATSTKAPTKAPTKVAASAPAVKKKKPSVPTPAKWRWPAKGDVIAKYSRNKGINGIRIAGKPGTPVVATAKGEVVYVGRDLRGYGQLVIVKHSDTHLSAYAHNRKILVKEGDKIKAGQQIAEMGNTGADRTMLQFEIRVNGKPQDPLRYLKS